MKIKNKSPKCQMMEDGSITLLEALEYEYAGCLIVVPAGFNCDGSSIPRFFWRVTGGPRDQKNLVAGVLHDYIYSEKTFDREFCDKIYLHALIEMEKNPFIAKGMYRAVRYFGKSHY